MVSFVGNPLREAIKGMTRIRFGAAIPVKQNDIKYKVLFFNDHKVDSKFFGSLACLERLFTTLLNKSVGKVMKQYNEQKRIKEKTPFVS